MFLGADRALKRSDGKTLSMSYLDDGKTLNM